MIVNQRTQGSLELDLNNLNIIYDEKLDFSLDELQNLQDIQFIEENLLEPSAGESENLIANETHFVNYELEYQSEYTVLSESSSYEISFNLDNFESDIYLFTQNKVFISTTYEHQVINVVSIETFESIIVINSVVVDTQSAALSQNDFDFGDFFPVGLFEEVDAPLYEVNTLEDLKFLESQSDLPEPQLEPQLDLQEDPVESVEEISNSTVQLNKPVFNLQDALSKFATGEKSLKPVEKPQPEAKQDDAIKDLFDQDTIDAILRKQQDPKLNSEDNDSSDFSDSDWDDAADFNAFVDSQANKLGTSLSSTSPISDDNSEIKTEPKIIDCPLEAIQLGQGRDLDISNDLKARLAKMRSHIADDYIEDQDSDSEVESLNAEDVLQADSFEFGDFLGDSHSGASDFAGST